jgi:hypothetical protein
MINTSLLPMVASEANTQPFILFVDSEAPRRFFLQASAGPIGHILPFRRRYVGLQCETADLTFCFFFVSFIRR